MLRTPIIAGNWKMNSSKAEAEAFLSELIPLVKDAKCEVALCVPFTLIEYVKDKVKGTNIMVGAQNVAWADKGAFTGEISASMLKEAGVTYAIVGHSERRQMFNETDETVNKRSKAALEKGLKVIICVGETLNEREDGVTESVIKRQTEAAFAGIDKDMLQNIVIAYEPVWAIGTGKTATKEQAQETIKFTRSVVEGIYGKTEADKIRIQYGGSMNAQNAAELMQMPDIDGGLIGGASLKAADFSKIVAEGK